MKDPENETIDLLAKRSNRSVIWITMLFAIGGALADIGVHRIFMQGNGTSMLWGMWIPFCFITIPPIHFLCRHVRTLEKRIAELEQHSRERRSGGVL